MWVIFLVYFSVLDNPHLCQLADEETPTSTSANLGTSDRVIVDEESEDYNDISSEVYTFHILVL